MHAAAQLTPALELSGTFFALFAVEMSATRAACHVPCWEPGVGVPSEWKGGHGEARCPPGVLHGQGAPGLGPRQVPGSRREDSLQRKGQW